MKLTVSKDCFESDDYISWTAFHANWQPDRVCLPIFYKNAHSVGMNDFCKENAELSILYML